MATATNHYVNDFNALSQHEGETAGDELASRVVGSTAETVAGSGLPQGEHFVQFYETDSFLLDSLDDFIGSGLRAGEAAIVISTRAHRDGLAARLEQSGVDVEAAVASGRYISLDAAATLAEFMVDGSPDETLFNEIVGAIIAQAESFGRHVKIFGEMVVLLWAEGNHDGAIRLEELWNELQQDHSFVLLCAYPMSGFGDESFAEPMQEVCSQHSHVMPAESYSALTDNDERLRAVTILQQKARALEAEIIERKQAEAALYAVKSELEMQVEDLRRLHEMSWSLTSTLNIESVLREVLSAALLMQHTDMGLLSLCVSDHNHGQDTLKVKVSSGFDEASLQLLEWVPPGAGVCDACYAQRRQIAIEDVESETVSASYREVAQHAGFRACHSTPLITRGGQIIGVLSVHFRRPHRPSERETRLMDLYARLAADSIENAQLHHQLQIELQGREKVLHREQLARTEAENANRMKDEFLATVSHELRTPLTAILGWSHLLRTGELDEATIAHGVEAIERNARTQAQLIGDILDVSRIVTGKLKLNAGPVNMATVIGRAIDAVQLAAAAKQVHIEAALGPAVRHITGDSGRLEQVIGNLLSNAIKFTPVGGRIWVQLEYTGSQARIIVNDSGQGIHADFLPFVFDCFRQADGTSTRRHGGLGLAIVRHLVELHDGTIEADSRGEGCGATFTVRLPLAIVPDGETPRRSEPGSPRAGQNAYADNGHADAQTPASLAGVLNGVKVLLVDDDGDSLQILTVILTEHKAQVQVAASAAEALEVFHWYQPDVLVSDLAMPEEDGCSLIGKVRTLAAQSGKPIPALAVTAYTRSEDRAGALEAGFNMFIPKPVEPHELITTVASLARLPTN